MIRAPKSTLHMSEGQFEVFEKNTFLAVEVPRPIHKRRDSCPEIGGSYPLVGAYNRSKSTQDEMTTAPPQHKSSLRGINNAPEELLPQASYRYDARPAASEDGGADNKRGNEGEKPREESVQAPIVGSFALWPAEVHGDDSCGRLPLWGSGEHEDDGNPPRNPRSGGPPPLYIEAHGNDGTAVVPRTWEHVAELPSLGSYDHFSKNKACKPCAFFHSPSGCGNDRQCPFCHLCRSGQFQRNMKIYYRTLRKTKGKRKGQGGG